MSGRIAPFTDGRNGTPSVIPEPLRETSVFDGMSLLPNKKSLPSSAPKEDEAISTLRKSSSFMASQPSDQRNFQNDEDVYLANLSKGAKLVDSRNSKPPFMDASSAECRICQEEDDLANLEIPCACTGSLKFAHRNCVQLWCNEKGDTVCEICQQPFGGGYTAPPASSQLDAVSIRIGDSWHVARGQHFDLNERFFAVTTEHLFSEADHEAYSRAHEQSATCFRSVALILMVLLLLRHVLSFTSVDGDEDPSTFLLFFALRTAGFFVPCYIMARALNALQCRRQRQEAALAAAGVAYILQSGQAQDVEVSVVPGF